MDSFKFARIKLRSNLTALHFKFPAEEEEVIIKPTQSLPFQYSTKGEEYKLETDQNFVIRLVSRGFILRARSVLSRRYFILQAQVPPSLRSSLQGGALWDGVCSEPVDLSLAVGESSPLCATLREPFKSWCNFDVQFDEDFASAHQEFQHLDDEEFPPLQPSNNGGLTPASIAGIALSVSAFALFVAVVVVSKVRKHQSAKNSSKTDEITVQEGL